MKQVILVRSDLDMSTGKAIAQGSHVSVLASRRADSGDVKAWLDQGGKKITLEVTSEEELRAVLEDAASLPTAVISDRGHTELEPGTTTAGAIGPADESDIDAVTGHLPLFN